MEIKPTGKSGRDILSGQSKPGVAPMDGTTFQDTIRESERRQRQETCSELLRQIDAQSDVLKKKPTPEGVKRYRELVTAFMKEAMNQSYHLDQHTRWDQYGNRKNMVLVKSIDKSLEELMDMVTGGAKSQVGLVAKLDQIRGLLLDLFI